MAVYVFGNMHVIFFHHEKALKVNDTVGNCAVICKRQSIQRNRDYVPY
jgi:hypothetical protein